MNMNKEKITNDASHVTLDEFTQQALAVKRIGKKRRYKIEPDPVYSSKLVSILTNQLMPCGNKSTVYKKIVLPALRMIQEVHKEDPCSMLSAALSNARPSVSVCSKAHYQVPVEIKAHTAFSMSVKFLVAAARTRKNQQMHKSLCQEIWDAANGRGAAVERKENLHRTAAANNAYRSYSQ